MESQELILVDVNDNELGSCEKLAAHRKGLLHRAFSIFIFDQSGNMLLQQRAIDKYHSGGLWTNACCSHPMPGEITKDAAGRRLAEELGIATSLEKIFDFVYHARVEHDLVEHEFDHVFVGEYSGEIPFNNQEVIAVCYAPMTEIKKELLVNPEQFTAWFKLAFEKINVWWNQRYGN